MIILHGKDGEEDFGKRFSEEFQRENEGLTPEEFVSALRLTAYQKKFCELFSEVAPKAWSDLQVLVAPGLQLLNAQFQGQIPGGDSQVSRHTSRLNNELRSHVESWATSHGINSPWVHFAAIMTIDGLTYSSIPFLSYPRPTSLIFDEYPVLRIDGDDVGIVRHRSEFVPYSQVVVNADLGDLVWDTLHETRAQFRNRVIAAFTKEIDNQLNETASSVPTSADLETHAHHVQWLIQRHVNGESIRSIATGAKVSRPAVRKGIREACTRLQLDPVPEDWNPISWIR